MAKTKKEEKKDLTEIKQELEEYIDNKIKNSFNEEIDKANKRLIREKNKKIIFRNVIIILLLIVIGFLIFLLYKNNYFDRFFNHNNTIVQDDKPTDEEPQKEEVPKITLEELISKYEKLFDSYYITSKCEYKNDLYNGILSSELKKYITLNNIDFNSIKSDDYNIINENTFKEVFNTLFIDGYISGDFDYNNNEIRYLKSLETYVSHDPLIKNDFDIVREILDIEEKNDDVLITTVEGVLKNNHLYNAVTNEEIMDFNGNSILNYQDKLNRITYVFKDNKLISLVK